MRMRNGFIGSVALCALAGVLGTGSSVFAQGSQSDSGLYGSAKNSPQVSTPAEKQETQALNERQINGTTEPAAVLNGEEHPAPSSGYVRSAQNESSPAYQPQPSYAEQQYNEQSEQYRTQQDQYQSQRRDYENERGRYYAQLHAYDIARYDWDYPAAVTYHYGDDYGLQRLYLIGEPSQQLANAPVEGPSGQWVGRVRNVDVAPDGRPERIEVALNRRVSVWVQPGDFRFDPVDHILYTDLRREDLWNMPGATVESGPM